MARKDLTKGRVRSATKGINGNKGLHKKVEYGKQKTESYELKTINSQNRRSFTVKFVV